MFENINEIMLLSRENGYTFFDKDRQRENKTRVLPTLYGGKFFIIALTFLTRLEAVLNLVAITKIFLSL